MKEILLEIAMHDAYAVINYCVMGTYSVPRFVLGAGDKNHQHLLLKQRGVDLEIMQWQAQ